MELMPPATLWQQFQVIGIIVLVVVVLALGARRFWREFTDWQSAQDSKRELEREKQRNWEAEQNEKREMAQDKREISWQGLVANMASEQKRQSDQTNEMLRDLVAAMNCISTDLRAHDAFARQALSEDAPPTKARGKRAA